MAVMTRFPAALAATLALAAVPASASADVIEIGATPDLRMYPSCSAPDARCLAVTRTTGYQAKVGTDRGLMIVPRNGRIVAWTLGLSNPTKAQKRFFEKNYGGAAQAQLTVLKVGEHLHDTVKAQGPLTNLEPYFGGTAMFPLPRTIPVRKGDLIAVTIPTWAPALQVESSPGVSLGGDTSWRASRSKKQCKDSQTQTAQLDKGDEQQYYCLYRTARLTYTATLIPYAKKTNVPKKKKSAKKRTRAATR
jgi:hypothetical protein